MLRQMARLIFAFFCAVSLGTAAAQEAPASPTEAPASKSAMSESTHGVRHALVGDIEKTDQDRKTVVVKTADGTEHAFKYTEHTAVHGIEGAAKASDLEGKKGTHVVVHYTERGAEKTADAFDDAGKDTWKETDGTIVKVDKAGHKVVVKAKDGSEKTYDLGKDATIDTEHGVVDATHFTAKEGDHVVVYHVEKGGKDVVHFLKHLGSKL